MSQINVTINNIPCTATAGQTILSVANEHNVYIPTLCYHKSLTLSGACGICVVAVEGTPRLLRACATPVTEGMVIQTETPQLAQVRKRILELNLSTHTGDCKAPCQLACPAETDCQGYIALIAQGQTEAAVKRMKEAHPFPASVARICPRPCEEKCRRKLVDTPVNIAGIKRYAADIHLNMEYTPDLLPPNGKSIAIIGGGPAGLTAAYFLKRAGYSATVFESMPLMGGLLRYGIPEYRLPKAILDGELALLTHMGITFANNMALGIDITLETLQTQHDGVIIAIGAGASKPMWCPGEDNQGVLGGIHFLKAVAEDPQAYDLNNKRVIVVGGSNTAMDAARTARRLGAQVYVSYRRTRDEMPAEKAEIEEAIAEGVEFLFLTAPREVTAENGVATGITLQKMALGEPDASGRRSPVPVEGADEWFGAAMIIGAIGQDVVLSEVNPLENLKVDENYRTSLPNVYAIGDATGKSWYAIDAIAHGRKVAAILMEDMATPWDVVPPVIVRDEKTATDFAATPHITRQAPAARMANPPQTFVETHESLTPDQIAKEVTRCLACGCDAFGSCELLKLSNMYLADVDKYKGQKKPQHDLDLRNPAITRDMNKCVHCYVCVRVCNQMAQEHILSATTRGFDATIDTAFNQAMPEVCKGCGKCAQECPTGALIQTS